DGGVEGAVDRLAHVATSNGWRPYPLSRCAYYASTSGFASGGSAPRIASQLTTSTDSVPPSLMKSSYLYFVSDSGSSASSRMNFLSHSSSTRPNCGPVSWCERPPVPTTTTPRSSSYERIALRSAWPSFQQRSGEGSGCRMTFTASGTIGIFQPLSPSLKSTIGSGEMTPWSTSSS